MQISEGTLIVKIYEFVDDLQDLESSLEDQLYFLLKYNRNLFIDLDSELNRNGEFSDLHDSLAKIK